MLGKPILQRTMGGQKMKPQSSSYKEMKNANNLREHESGSFPGPASDKTAVSANHCTAHREDTEGQSLVKLYLEC